MSSSSSKNSSLFTTIIIFFFFFFTLSATIGSSHPSIGITYTNRGSTARLPHQQKQLVSLLQSLKITSIRLLDSDPDVIRSFSFSKISLLLSIPNSLIPTIAANSSEALRWLNHHITPFYPRVIISTISVGNNVVEENSDATTSLSTFLLPAIQNVRGALDELGLDKISVSSTFSFVDVITTAFPPSSAEFKDSVAESLIKPLLNLLSQTNSSFLINLYPYNLYRTEPMIPLGYAIFQEDAFYYRDDLMTGVRYRNLFDMMVDSVITAMALEGHEDVPITVTETGWPSWDETKDVDANHIYAEMYIKGLVRHVKSGLGTPLRKDGVKETYIFELFDHDEDKKDSSGSKRQWGILNPDMSQKYNIDFSDADRVKGVDDLTRKMLISLLLIGWLLYQSRG